MTAYARNSDPITSHQAGVHTDDRAAQVWQQLLAFSRRPMGLNSHESTVEAGIPLYPGSPWRRVSDLVEKGLVAPVMVNGKPLTRKGSTHQPMKVYRITRAGEEAVARGWI